MREGAAAHCRLVKRGDLIRHVRQAGCELYREGSSHSIYWNPQTKRTTAVPRHSEISDLTAKIICGQLFSRMGNIEDNWDIPWNFS